MKQHVLIGLVRAMIVGATCAMLADGWKSYVGGILLLAAFWATDSITERRIAERTRTRNRPLYGDVHIHGGAR